VVLVTPRWDVRVEVALFLQLADLFEMCVVNVRVHPEQSLEDRLGHLCEGQGDDDYDHHDHHDNDDSDDDDVITVALTVCGGGCARTGGVWPV
jgi:hypothetical protein